MPISFQAATGLYEQALSLRAERATILSANLANVNTPGYKARDMDFSEVLNRQTRGALRGNLHGSHSGHFTSGTSGALAAERLYRQPLQPSIDGNTVEEQVENAEFMQNNLQFQVAFTLLNSRFKGLSKAIRGE